MDSKPDLEILTAQLQDAGINFWIATRPWSYIEVALIAPTGEAIRTQFAYSDSTRHTRNAIAQWVRRTAHELYPDYADSVTGLAKPA